MNFHANASSLITFLPALVGIVILGTPSDRFRVHRYLATLGTLATFFVSLVVWGLYDAQLGGFQFQVSFPWIESLGVTYSMGVDGISLPLILLTTFLMPIAVVGSFTAIQEKVRSYYALLLFLETGMLGAFCATDLVLFYMFWEAMLIPMYFLIGVWGGQQRVYASMKFFLYTLVGSLLMLVAIFYLMYQHKEQFGVMSSYLPDLLHVRTEFSSVGWSPQTLLFLAFSLAFAIKVPLFPLHTWLPDAHVQAPTAGSLILAGVLLKLGGFGFLRYGFPLFPQAAHFVAPWFLALSCIAIVYGALVAMVQPDIKKLVAYSSVSHMGYVMLGLFSFQPTAMAGAVYQMLNHGISTGALFLIVGMLYERRHTREISQYGGLAKVVPLMTVIFLIVTMSSIALPGTNGFIGEFLILLGSFQVAKVPTIIAGTGVVLGAVYMLWVFKRMMFGPLENPENAHLKDVSTRELVVMTPLLVAIFVMGLFPGWILSKIDLGLQPLIKILGDI